MHPSILAQIVDQHVARLLSTACEARRARQVAAGRSNRRPPWRYSGATGPARTARGLGMAAPR